MLLLLLLMCVVCCGRMLCEVDRSYIEDGFNLYGLRHHFSNFQGCLDIILDRTGTVQSVQYIFLSCH